MIKRIAFLAAVIMMLQLNTAFAAGDLSEWDYVLPLKVSWGYDEHFQGYSVVEKDGKRGLVNPDGELLCDVKWKMIEGVTPWLFHAADEQTGCTYDLNGNEIIQGVVDGIRYETFCRVYNAAGEEGLITVRGDVLIDLTSEAPEFQVYKKDDIYIVEIDEKWGVIDQTGYVLAYPQYHSLQYLSRTRMAVQKDEGGLWGLIDQHGNVILEPRYDRIVSQSEGYIRFKQNGYYGFMDLDGNVMIEPNLYNAGDFSCGLAYVGTLSYYGEDFEYHPSLCGFIDTSGRVVIAPQWEFVSGFSEGYSTVMNDGLYGYINMDGELICDLIWDEARAFENGRAQVYKDGKVGYIDTAGNLIVPLQ